MASSLEKLEQSHHVEIKWRSFELRPKDAPPISEAYRAKILANRPRVYAVAREQYGLDMNPGPFGFDSRPALIGAKYAERHDVGPTYHAAVMNAYWRDGRDIEQVDALASVATDSGLDADEFRSALENDAYREAVLADIAQAHEYGIQGVPGMIFNDKYYLSGAQPYDLLVEAVEKITEEG